MHLICLKPSEWCRCKVWKTENQDSTISQGLNETIIPWLLRLMGLPSLLSRSVVLIPWPLVILVLGIWLIIRGLRPVWPAAGQVWMEWFEKKLFAGVGRVLFMRGEYGSAKIQSRVPANTQKLKKKQDFFLINIIFK